MDITPLDVEYENGQDEAAGSAGLAPELVVTTSSPMTSGSRALGRDSPDGERVRINNSLLYTYITVVLALWEYLQSAKYIYTRDVIATV